MKEIRNYGSVRINAHNDEHDELDRLTDAELASKLPAAQDPIINLLYQQFHNNFVKEEEVMKPIMASPLTPVLEHADRERSIEVNAVCHVVETNVNNEFEPDRKAAAIRLLPIVRAYKGIARRNLTGETSYIRNFVYEFQLPANAAAVATLGLAQGLTRADSLNQQFENYLADREHNWPALHTGSLKPLRRELDINFRNIAECINIHYLASILSGSPSLALEQIIDAINDIIRPFRRSLAHRGIHVPASPNDPDFQYPDISLPTVNPDDLNPPAVGEH